MVNDDLANTIRAIERSARRNGWDFADALAKSGLLLTESRRKALVAVDLDLLLYQLEQQQPTTFQMLGGGQPTVTDAANGVIEFIRMYRKMYE